MIQDVNGPEVVYYIIHETQYIMYDTWYNTYNIHYNWCYFVLTLFNEVNRTIILRHFYSGFSCVNDVELWNVVVIFHDIRPLIFHEIRPLITWQHFPKCSEVTWHKKLLAPGKQDWGRRIFRIIIFLLNLEKKILNATLND